VNYTECSFIDITSTAGLSRRKLESLATFSDKRCAQDSNIRNLQYIQLVTMIIMIMILVIMTKNDY